MLKQNDRVRFKDAEKDSQYGVLVIFSIKGQYATIGNGSYEAMSQNMMTVLLAELKPAE
ncbi:hypothetical protein [Ferruginibacter sp.]